MGLKYLIFGSSLLFFFWLTGGDGRIESFLRWLFIGLGYWWSLSGCWKSRRGINLWKTREGVDFSASSAPFASRIHWIHRWWWCSQIVSTLTAHESNSYVSLSSRFEKKISGSLDVYSTKTVTRVRNFPHVDGNYALHAYIPGNHSFSEIWQGFFNSQVSACLV